MKGKQMSDFILASASPRRKELLERLGIDFEIIVSEANEGSIPKDIPVKLYVQELAMLKACAAARQVLKNKNARVIAADTVVTLDGEVLGKPKDGEDAFNMLKSLSGRCHEVYTGICVMRMRDAKTVCRAVKTDVRFKELTDEKVRAYIATGEPMDKAGAYGIQGIGAVLVDGIDGDYFNVVGLPLAALSDVLENEFDVEIL